MPVLDEARAFSHLVVQPHRRGIAFVGQPVHARGAFLARLFVDMPDQLPRTPELPRGRSHIQVLQIAVVAGGPGRAMKKVVHQPHHAPLHRRNGTVHWLVPMAQPGPGGGHRCIVETHPVELLVTLPHRTPAFKIMLFEHTHLSGIGHGFAWTPPFANIHRRSFDERDRAAASYPPCRAGRCPPALIEPADRPLIALPDGPCPAKPFRFGRAWSDPFAITPSNEPAQPWRASPSFLYTLVDVSVSCASPARADARTRCSTHARAPAAPGSFVPPRWPAPPRPHPPVGAGSGSFPLPGVPPAGGLDLRGQLYDNVVAPEASDDLRAYREHLRRPVRRQTGCGLARGIDDGQVARIPCHAPPETPEIVAHFELAQRCRQLHQRGRHQDVEIAQAVVHEPGDRMESVDGGGIPRRADASPPRVPVHGGRLQIGGPQ